jgi:hypothetical protein
MRKTNAKKSLQLNHQTIRSLDHAQLVDVPGGAGFSNTCSKHFTGCCPQ